MVGKLCSKLGFASKAKNKDALRNQSGNIFFMLFGAVAVVGLLGATIVSTMRGPLSTMVEVQSRAKAESEMAIGSRLALLEATEAADDGDCDGDGFIEPLEWSDASGLGPTGGGFLPPEVSSSRMDPWGIEYGYCAWDAGGTISDAACDNGGGSPDGNYNRLAGTGTNDQTYTVIAIISAGADQVFETSCYGGAFPSVSKGGDDIVVEYTYATAAVATGGLWNLKSGEPNVAEIHKELEVSGNIDLSIGGTGSGQLILGAASLLFPTDSVLTLCNSANNGLIRINTSTAPDSLELCDDPAGWVPVGGATGIWQQGTGDDIYYNTGTPQVGIGTTTPDDTLDVVGSAEITGNTIIGGTLDVTGTTTLASLSAQATTATTLGASGNATIGGTLGVTGTSTLDALNAQATTTTTLDASGNATIGGTLGVTGISTLAALNAQATTTTTLDASGNATIGGTLDITGATTVNNTLDIAGDFDVGGGDFTVDSATGNVNVGGTMDTSGDATFGGDVIVSSSDSLIPPNCATDKKLEWGSTGGWSCVDDSSGPGGASALILNDLDDVNASSPTTNNCLVYNGSKWVDSSCSASGGIWEDGGTMVRIIEAGSWAIDDFVFGSSQLNDDGNTDHDARFFFDKSKGAFRAGNVSGTHWDDGNIGINSAAFGVNVTSSGENAFAAGTYSSAQGKNTIALGNQAETTAEGAMAIGRLSTASAMYANVRGNTVNSSGMYSFAYGLGEASGVYPVVSGASSFGIFMGDQSGYNLTTDNRFALVGGDFLIDDDGTAGSQGCIDYLEGTGLRFSDDCASFTAFNAVSGLWTDLGGGRIHYGTTSATQVGVGTSNPQTTLDVNGGIRVGRVSGAAPTYMNLSDLGDTDTSAQADGTCLVYNDSTSKWEAQSCSSGSGGGSELIDTDGNTQIQVEEAANDDTIRFDTAGTERMTIDPTGLVEIQNSGRLRIRDGDIDFTHNGNVRIQGSTSEYMSFYTNGTERMRIRGTGNVGIGTTSPLVALDIGGTIKIANGGETCDGTIPGAMRYNAGTLEFCDGTSWKGIGVVTGAIDLVITPSNANTMDITGPVVPTTGATVSFTVTNLGSVTTDSLTYSLTGDTANFVVTGDTCTGNTLAGGANCQIDIHPTASGNVTYAATLTIPHHDTPLATMSGEATGFGCSPGQTGFGGIVVQCDYAGTGNHLIINESGCDGSTTNPSCSGTDTIGRAWANTNFASRTLGGSVQDNSNGAQNSVNMLSYSLTPAIDFPAASYCDQLNDNGETDWFLPAAAEISTACSNLAGIGGFLSGPYSSSQERDDNQFYALNIPACTGSGSGSGYKGTTTYGLRCMRIEGVGIPSVQADTTPGTISFATRFASSAGAATASSTQTISGISANTAISISGSTAEYSINGGAWGATSGTISWGDTVAVRINSGAAGARVQANLTIGSSTFAYSVITEDDCGGGGCTGIDKRVFVTSTTYNGNLGGFSGADAKCQAQADDAAIGGTWRVILSGNSASQWAINRMDYNWDRLVNMNGDVVATSGEDLWDGSLSNPINYDEAGASRNVSVRTASTDAGEIYPQYNEDCAGWTGTGQYTYGRSGKSSAADAKWINESNDAGCNTSTLALYCQEVDTSSITLTSTPSSGANMNVTAPGAPSIGTEVIFTIENTGTGTSSILGTSITNSTNFQITTDTCAGNTLAPAATCTVGVTPQAYADGNYYGTLTILDSTNNISANIGLSGVSSGYGISAAGVFEVNGASGSEVISSVDASAPYATADLVFGSPQLDDDGDTDHDARMFFDKSKAAFRVGKTAGAEWNETNIGDYSIATGSDSTAMGASSASFGRLSSSAGTASFAAGYSTTASGLYSIALGADATAGDGVAWSGAGDHSMAIGLGLAAGTSPRVSGNSSLGIFMGDQSGYDLATANRMALVGGDFLIDDDGTAGSQGCIRYLEGTGLQFSDDCSTYSAFSGGGSLWTDNTTHITRENFHIMDTGATIASTSLNATGSRSFYYADKRALRGGFLDTANTAWDEVSIGSDSIAWGRNARAGAYSAAFGRDTTASGAVSIAMGYIAEASGSYSVALGRRSTASAINSVALGYYAESTGDEAAAFGAGAKASGYKGLAFGNARAGDGTASDGSAPGTGLGDSSAAFGLGTTAGTKPQVTGDESFGIFLGDQSGYDLTTDNRMALVGGDFLIDDDGTAGSQGCIRFVEGTGLQFSHDCSTFTTMGSVASGALAIDDLSDGVTDYANNNLYLGQGTGGSNGIIANYHVNMGIGVNALANIGTGCAAAASWQCQYNVALGYEALNDATTATSNIAIGYRALDNATTDIGNTAIGENSLGSLTGGQSHNTVIGPRSATALATGGYNVMLGVDVAASSFTSGSSNTFLGEGSANVLTSGSNNVFIGQDSGNSQTSGSSNILIGRNVQAANLAGDNQLNIGNLIYGDLVNGDFIVGSYQLDDTTTGTEDARMFFDKSKAAFRAGSVTGAEWDDGSVGGQSFAVGENTTASGDYSFASGSGSIATGEASFAVGANAEATEDYSVAFGDSSIASGYASFAVGEGSEASGSSSIAMGASSANGLASIALGNATATGTSAVAIGDALTATSNNSIVFGKDAVVNAATGKPSMAIGLGSSLNTATRPQVTGDGSLGIFMGDNTGYTLSDNNTVAIVGAGSKLMFVGDYTAGPTVKGCISYSEDDSELQYSDDCSTYISFKNLGSAFENASGVVRNKGTHATDDFVFGSSQLNDTGTATDDSRFFFDKSKGAFRAGSVLSTEWDTANVGDYSIAFGQSTTASGEYSSALGQSTTASGEYSVALGSDTTASGYGSLSMGEGSEASSDYSVAFGENSTSSGFASFAAGEGVTASGNNSVAFGSNTTASTFYSVAMGVNSTSAGSASLAIGSDVTANGTTSIALGNDVTAGLGGGAGDYTLAIGLGEATGARPIVSGDSSVGIFMGDQSGTNISTANVMAIMGGKVGIGVAAPDVALDVDGDIEYSGTITDVSDMRLKDNITPMDDMLSRLAQVDTYSFTMKDDENHRVEFGVMAQELEKIFPELVHTAKDEIGTKSVNYVGLIAPMITATKELKAENAALKAELTEIKTAQAQTKASLTEINEQVMLLNKMAGKNVEKASVNSLLMLLMGLLGGAALIVFIQRRKA